jgi:hypothetical protein
MHQTADDIQRDVLMSKRRRLMTFSELDTGDLLVNQTMGETPAGISGVPRDQLLGDRQRITVALTRM